MSEYLTPSDVANILKLNPQTIRRYANSGKIHAIRIGRRLRIERAEVERFVREAKDA